MSNVNMNGTRRGAVADAGAWFGGGSAEGYIGETATPGYRQAMVEGVSSAHMPVEMVISDREVEASSSDLSKKLEVVNEALHTKEGCKQITLTGDVYLLRVHEGEVGEQGRLESLTALDEIDLVAGNFIFFDEYELRYEGITPVFRGAILLGSEDIGLLDGLSSKKSLKQVPKLEILRGW